MTTQTADDVDTTTSIPEGTALLQAAPGREHASLASTASRTFVTLTTEVLPAIPSELQWPLYQRISAAVTKGTLPGMIHGTLTGQLTYVLSASKQRPKVVKEILLKNLPDLQGAITQLTEQVFGDHVIATGGRGFSAEDLHKMGDALNFDAMIAAARKRRTKLCHTNRTKKERKA